MGLFRLYTGNDGVSHGEERTLTSHPALQEPQATVHIQYRELPAGAFMDWHPAPRRPRDGRLGEVRGAGRGGEAGVGAAVAVESATIASDGRTGG